VKRKVVLIRHFNLKDCLKSLNHYTVGESNLPCQDSGTTIHTGCTHKEPIHDNFHRH